MQKAFVIQLRQKNYSLWLAPIEAAFNLIEYLGLFPDQTFDYQALSLKISRFFRHDNRRRQGLIFQF